VDAQAPAAGVEEAVRATALGRERLSEGDIKGAEAAVESAIEIQGRELGNDDLEVAASVARAAMLHVAENDLDGAKLLYERALAIRERRLGPDSVGAARILDDLARIHAGYAEDPNPTEASHLLDTHALLQRSLDIRENALGPEHPDVAIGLYNLALDYTWRTSGASGERPLYLRALAIREKAFGGESAPVVDSLLRLARYDEAVGLTLQMDRRAETMTNAAKSRERALQIQEKLYGGDSIELVDNLTSLAELHVNRNVGEKSAAVPLLDRALTIAEKTFGAADFSRAMQIEVLQPEYNLYDRAGFEEPLRDLRIAEDISVITYYSLAKGFLSGKYRSEADLGQSPRGGGVKDYLNARGFRILAALDDVAARCKAAPADVALAWIIAQPSVAAPIASATSLPQLESLIRAASLTLSASDIAALDEASAA
jgi:hypothetical protein